MNTPASEAAWKMLKTMLLIRRFEERAAELYSAEKIRGFLHLYIGEEAVAGGIIPALAPEDAVVATYREHGHALARGVTARAVMAEMFGKVEGTSRGRGGSMHIFNAATRFYGGNAIVGGGLPVAAGLALADRLLNRRCVTACFFGEGAMAEGEFHESMNLAALWQLPVLFVCENNLYAMGTSLSRSESQVDLCAKASSYKMDAHTVDGMDALAVAEMAADLTERIRENKRPQFLECRTYRFRAHSMFDPDLYRDKDEIRRWQKRDPVALLTQKMRDLGFFHEGKFAEITASVEREIADAVEYAEHAHLESVADLLRDVYTPQAHP